MCNHEQTGAVAPSENGRLPPVLAHQLASARNYSHEQSAEKWTEAARNGILTVLGSIGAPRAIGLLVGLAEEANTAGVGTGLASGIVGEAGEARPGAAGIGAVGVEAGAEVLATAETPVPAGTPVPAENTPTVPQNALDTLDHVDRTGTAPQGYKGGAPFLNDGRGGGQIIPAADAQGNPMTYQEWDVNPTVPGVNRGAQRLVIGSDGSAYYTDDHYKTFTRIR